MGRNGYLATKVFIMGLDGSIKTQNCRDRMDYIRG